MVEKEEGKEEVGQSHYCRFIYLFLIKLVGPTVKQSGKENETNNEEISWSSRCDMKKECF